MIVTPLAITFFFFNDTATTEIYTLSLHDALPISSPLPIFPSSCAAAHQLVERNLLVNHLRFRQNPFDYIGFEGYALHLRQALRLHIKPFYYLGGTPVGLRLLPHDRPPLGGLRLQGFGARELGDGQPQRPAALPPALRRRRP